MASGSSFGSARVDAVDPRVGALQDGVGLDLGRPQRGRGVGGEERVARAAGEDHDPALLQVADGAAADVRLGHLRHLQRGHDPGGLIDPLERVLQRQPVHHRGDHAHVVGLGLVHALARALQATPEVPAADHDGQVDAELPPRLDHLGRDLVEDGR